MADAKKLTERKELKKKHPAFKRESNTKRIKFKKDTAWRRPKGRHSKLRHQMAGHAKKVMPGFRTDNAVRGLHPSGLIAVVVNAPSDISKLDKSIHGVIVGSTVGARKKLIIIEAVKKAGLQILNLKDNHASKIEETFKKRKAAKAERLTKKAEKEKSKKEKEKKETKEEKKELNEEEKAEQEKKEKEKILTKAKK